MTDRLAQLIAEHESDEPIGPLIFAVIKSALKFHARHYAPTSILDRDADQLTDDDYEDLAIQFAEFLLRRGRLTEAFAYAQTEAQFGFILRRRASQFLQNKSREDERRAELRNIHDRAARLLRTDPRFTRERGAQTWWRLSGYDCPHFEGAEQELRHIAHDLPYPKSARRRRRDTTIAASILTDADLAGLLEATLRITRAALTLRQFDVVIDERLGLWATETISLQREDDDQPSIEEIFGSEDVELDRLELAQLTSDLAAVLTVRQTAVLRVFGQRGTREETARALSVSSGTVTNVLRRIGALALQLADGDSGRAKRALLGITDRLLGR